MSYLTAPASSTSTCLLTVDTAMRRKSIENLPAAAQTELKAYVERGLPTDPEPYKDLDIGGLSLSLVTTDEAAARQMLSDRKLDLLVIAPDHQRRGLGTSLLRSLMDEAEGRRVPLWLSVHRDNVARRLYARLGFRELDRDERRVFMVHPATTTSPPPS